MAARPKVEEKYKHPSGDVINFVVYTRTEGDGEDEVLQHKLLGKTETAHITLHPDGSINFRKKRSKEPLKEAVLNKLADYKPSPSARLKKFLAKVRSKV